MLFIKFRCKTFVFALFFVAAFAGAAAAQKKAAVPDVVFVPTGEKIAAAMLELAQVSADDTVYDLGCGDGRLVIAAAQTRGARGVGIDIDSELIERARDNARRQGVEKLAKFARADIFKANFKRATVVMLYLSPSVNLRLRPRLLKQLKPGTRVVSHDFGMGDWQPDKTVKVDEATLYLWTVPANKPLLKNE